jgi:hypothetical protein
MKGVGDVREKASKETSEENKTKDQEAKTQVSTAHQQGEEDRRRRPARMHAEGDPPPDCCHRLPVSWTWMEAIEEASSLDDLVGE